MKKKKKKEKETLNYFAIIIILCLGVWELHQLDVRIYICLYFLRDFFFCVSN